MLRRTFLFTGASALLLSRGEAAMRSVPRFAFFSDFTINLHHTLYRQADVLQTVYDAGLEILDPRRRRIYDEITSIPTSDRDVWYRALAFYEKHYDRLSLIFDNGMVQIDNDLPSGVLPKNLLAEFELVASIYRRSLWPRHDASNRRRIKTLRSNLAIYGEPLFTKLRYLLRTPWLSQTYRVDVVASTDRDGAYSNGDDLKRFWHIFLSSYDRENDGLSDFELLAHEATHSIVNPNTGTVGGAISAYALRLDRPVPDDLWHVIIMYLPGSILSHIVASQGGGTYQSTFYTAGLFTRDYPRYYAAISRHFGPYIQGDGTLNDAIEATVRDVVIVREK